jgi:methionine synthase II (cobalamin-independent)
VFATVLGGLPRPTGGPVPADPEAREASDDAAVRAVIGAQEAAGIELVSDGRLRGEFSPASPVGSSVAAWRFAVGCTALPVKQALPGPYTLARAGGGGWSSAVALADRLRAEVDALAAAGCPLVEIDEPAAVEIASDPAERAIFVEAHRRLAIDAGVHLTLALTGGNVDAAGAATFVEPPYASYAVDLVAGPDNWRVVAEIPADRGVVCGALRRVAGSDDGPELLVWAAHYAASTGGRGLDRVGLANAPGLSSLPWEVVAEKLTRLGEAARIAGLPRTGELAAALDPRATDLRSRAFGRHMRKRGGNGPPG